MRSFLTTAAVALIGSLLYTQPSQAQGVKAGVAAMVDTYLVRNVKNYIMPLIINEINTTPIPRINFDGGYVDKVNVQLNQRDNNSISLSFNQKSNGAILRALNIEGQITGSIRYKILFVSLDADFKVTFDYGGVSMQTTLPLSTQTVANGRQLPKVDVSDLFVAFDPSKIHITLSGSVIADVLDKIVWTFKSVVISTIQKVINDQVPSQVQDVLNEAIVASNGLAPLGEGFGLDFQMPASPIVTNTDIKLFLNATLYDTERGYSVPLTPVSTLDVNLTDRAQMMVDASAYTVDSFLNVIQGKEVFSFALDDTTFDGLLSDYLSTTYLDGILPGLVDKYGADVPMKINFKSTSSPKSFFNVNQVGANISAQLDFIVGQEVAVGMLITDAYALVNPALQNLTLSVQVLKFMIQAIQVTSSTIGEVEGNDLRVFLNTLFRMITPFANKFLMQGFPIPSQFFGVVSVKSAKFSARQGYIQIGFVPEFI